MALSAVLYVTIGFTLLDDLVYSFDILNNLGIGMDIYILVCFALEAVIAIGLFFVQGWARNFTIWWGILAVIAIVTSIRSPSPWLVTNILQVFSAISVLVAGKDFKEEKKPVDDNQGIVL
jgi:hypothetical protein